MSENFWGAKKRYEETKKLCADAIELTKALYSECKKTKDADAYHDWDFFYWRVTESNLLPLLGAMESEGRIGRLAFLLQKNVEDEEVRREAGKVYQRHVRENLLPQVEALADSAKAMEFKDGRVRDFQERMGEVMQNMKKAYEHILNEDKFK